MISNQGEFLVDINQFLAELKELESILESYQVSAVSELKSKIDNREVVEHPSYEDYLDALHLYESLKEKQNTILQSIQGVDLDKLE